MKIPATSPFAALMGLPPRIRKKAKAAAKPKARNRERRTVQVTRKVRGATARREVRSASHKRSFAELLDVATPAARTVQRQPRPIVAGAPVPQSEPASRRDGLTPAARRIIELSAAARGEAPLPDDIEAQLRRDHDEACGITEVARAIIDRKGAKVAAGSVRSSGRETV